MTLEACNHRPKQARDVRMKGLLKENVQVCKDADLWSLASFGHH